MNRKHLLWHVFNSLERGVVEDLIDALENNKVRYSENPQPGEISVAESMRERYEAYKKDVKNGV